MDDGVHGGSTHSRDRRSSGAGRKQMDRHMDGPAGGAGAGGNGSIVCVTCCADFKAFDKIMKRKAGKPSRAGDEIPR